MQEETSRLLGKKSELPEDSLCKNFSFRMEEAAMDKVEMSNKQIEHQPFSLQEEQDRESTGEFETENR